MNKIAVLIPCYNESATIAKVIADYRAVLPEAMLFALCFVILKRIAI